jgi:peptidoglycan/LPS O-acetylase OafA/YrhL
VLFVAVASAWAGDDRVFVSVTLKVKPLRRDIEGLRAIAVLAVIMNHVSPARLPGGFAGVDVFFVISGYLIGTHLLEDIGAGRFSFLGFYARRARRLLPALVVVLAAVWAFGALILSPEEFGLLGRHVAAAAVFSNNILLWSESGYFDTASAGKPLLHLWSLGAEEQFYLLVPLLLWLGARGRQASVAWIARVSALSLLLTLLSASPSFYLLHTRFWELGIGVLLGALALNARELADGTAILTRSAYRESLCWNLVVIFAATVALGSGEPRWTSETWLSTCTLLLIIALAIGAIQLTDTYPRRHKWLTLLDLCRRHESALRGALGAAGVALIVASFACVTAVAWPGAQTVVPVIGTSLLILAGPQSRANALIGSRPCVFIGGISYPLYLWHWPLIVYSRMLDYSPGVSTELTPVLLAIVLAWLTKELVESPARFGRLFDAVVYRPAIALVCSGLIAAGLVGVITVAEAGFPGRFPPELSAIAGWSIPNADAAWRVHQCYLYPGETGAFGAECTPQKRAGVPRILLWGDSHAAQLYPGLVELRKRSDFDLVQWTAAGCPPTRVPWPGEFPSCQQHREWILTRTSAVAPDTVLVAARWELYDAEGTAPGSIVSALIDDIEWLRSLGIRHIVVFGPGPAWNTSLPIDLFRYMGLRRTYRVPERLGTVRPRERKLDQMLSAATVARGAHYQSELDWFCNMEGCRTLGHETQYHPDLLFRDEDHLTPSGSRDLVVGSAEEILEAPRTALAQ